VEAADEALDGAGARIAVVEAGVGQPAGVDATAVAQERFELGREVEDAETDGEFGVRSVGAFGDRSRELRRDGSDYSRRGSHYRVDTVGGDVARSAG
jgi:hypothetical protein